MVTDASTFKLDCGSTFHKRTSWWHHNGEFRRPTAVAMPNRCACGWHGTVKYPIGRVKVREDDDLDAHDTSGPYEEWAVRLDTLAERAVTLPEDLMALLGQVRERLDRLWLEDDSARGYAAMMKACSEPEAIVAETGPEAARTLRAVP
ncbi:hypothetical protein [Streptomyces sp. NPDC088757]|uniref:hypothetical protein n=1 Tax=Streptomyces sp. NPDC088757 TaxID=3365889 RepID=UPI00381DCEBC